MNEEADSAMRFPCEFPIKAMGKSVDNLHTIVMEIMNRHVEGLHESAVSCRPSSKGNFVSITVTITARSREQLDAIYRDLSACNEIIMAL
ncbi:MAG: DUF493 family protein YbeD [Gammaproteobacteria bacterium]|nr:MAG: DUF493 family protein YbeD [Gammaproteobacteria bacterium]